MPLVQALVELHKGHMKIKSVVGQGTSVTVEFPMVSEVVSKEAAITP
jgi:signal transduction histidine kinase